MKKEKQNSDVVMHPWPKAKKELIREAKKWRESAELGSDLCTWERYANAYRSASEVLLSYYLNRKGRYGFYEINDLILPIMGLIRHSLELMIKYLLIQSYELYKLPSKVYAIHDLNKLLDTFANLIEMKWEDRKEEVLEGVRNVQAGIRQMLELDPHAQFFRYPVDVKGKPMEIERRDINVRFLYESFNNMFEQLDTIRYILEVKLTKYKQEAEIDQETLGKIYAEIWEDQSGEFYHRLDELDEVTAEDCETAINRTKEVCHKRVI